MQKEETFEKASQKSPRKNE